MVPSVIVNIESRSTKQVAQPMSPKTDNVMGVVADTATVPEALGKVMVLLATVGSVKARIKVILSSVVPSSTNGEAPRICALDKVTLPVEVRPVNEATPGPVTDQLGSFKAKSPVEPLPIVIVPELVPVPMLVALAPEVFMLVAPVAVKLVKAPAAGVVAPIAVEFMPVAVVLKLADVKVISLAPVEIEEALRPESASAPDVAVKFNAPVVCVKPLEAVSSPAEVIVPVPVV